MKKFFSSIFVAVLLLTFVAAASAFADTITLPAMLSDLGEAAFQNDQSLDTHRNHRVGIIEAGSTDWKKNGCRTLDR